MFSVNDDYYVIFSLLRKNLRIQEDLTVETANQILDSIKKGQKVKPGPQTGRKTCEPFPGGKTSLLEPPPSPGQYCRPDL